MIVIGIDPGMGGALAVLNEDRDCESIAMPTMGEKAQKLVDGGAIARFLGDHDVQFAVVEMASARPGQGVSGMFRFGAAYGAVLGVLQACCIPYETVTPAKWKREMGLSKDKALSRRRAIERLPRAAKQFERVKDEGRAEAALLTLWWLEKRELREAA